MLVYCSLIPARLTSVRIAFSAFAFLSISMPFLLSMSDSASKRFYVGLLVNSWMTMKVGSLLVSFSEEIFFGSVNEDLLAN